MKLKNISDLLNFSKEDLLKELDSASKELFTMKMQLQANALKETHKIKVFRKYVARIKTIGAKKWY